jgi:hypothetical protein
MSQAGSPLVRTDFGAEDGWRHLVELATAASPDGFKAELWTVEDRALEGAGAEALAADRRFAGQSVLFVADTQAIEDCESALLAVDLDSEPGRSFRVVPGALWGVENNLRLANMDFGEFADAAGDDSPFRGF